MHNDILGACISEYSHDENIELIVYSDDDSHLVVSYLEFIPTHMQNPFKWNGQSIPLVFVKGGDCMAW